MINIIREKFNEARKTKDSALRSAYESVIAKIITAEKSGKYKLPLSDDIVIELIQKEIKEIGETKECFVKITPPQPTTCFDIQINELKKYCPTPFTDDEVLEIIGRISNGETNKGKLIGLTVKSVGARFDKSKIAGLVDKFLRGE